MQADGPDVFRLARRIRGLEGVELQIHYRGETMWNRPTLLAYRDAARAEGLAVPSLAGVWEKGVNLMLTTPAELSLRRAVDAAAELNARVILVAAFKDNIPRMNDPASYEPVVAMLQRVAPHASQAGVTLGLETSLSPADDRKLIDLVNHRAVQVYWDLDNTEFYGHKGASLTGIDTLGAPRVCQVHCKNEDRPIEAPGRVDWAAALKRLKASGYKGWLVFESRHTSSEQCIEATERNIAFVRKCWNL